jgi:hypothetical protein
MFIDSIGLDLAMKNREHVLNMKTVYSWQLFYSTGVWKTLHFCSQFVERELIFCWMLLCIPPADSVNVTGCIKILTFLHQLKCLLNVE